MKGVDPATRPVLPILFLTILVEMVGFGILIPILPLYALRFGASPPQIGALMALYSGLQFLLSPLFGRISDRVGRRPILFASMIGAGAGYLLMAGAHTLSTLFLARAITGLSGASIATAQACIADITPPERRARGMGIVGAAIGLGLVLGPLLGGTASLLSPAAPFLLAALLSSVNAALLFLRLPETRPARALARRPARAPRTPDLLRVAGTNFLATCGISTMTALFALYTARAHGYDERANAALLTFIGIIATVVQGGLIGRLADALGERPLAVAGAALSAAGLLALPLARGFPALMGACALFALGHSLFSPSISSLASHASHSAHQGEGLGLVQSSGSLARLLGPLLGGALFDLRILGPGTQPGTATFCAGAALALASIPLLPRPLPAIAPSTATPQTDP